MVVIRCVCPSSTYIQCGNAIKMKNMTKILQTTINSHQMKFNFIDHEIKLKLIFVFFDIFFISVCAAYCSCQEDIA